jgi:superfamily II DNA or RNA helicase
VVQAVDLEPDPVPIPCLRLFTEPFLVRSADGAEEELTLPVLGLSFDYAGTLIGAGDARSRFFIGHGAALRPVERDRVREAKARTLLERLGAVEIGCLEGYTESYGSTANYLVAVDGDTHTYCAFSAHTVPELVAQGFVVHVAPDYPYQVQAGELHWYLNVEPLGERPDWFNCELGVEVEGQRVNLLGPLLDVLESVPDAESLQRLSLRSLRSWALPVGEHRHLSIPRELLWDLLEVLRELYSGRRAGPELELSRYRGPALEALVGAFARAGQPLRRSGVRLPAPAALAPADAAPDAQAASSGFRATLRPYQAEGVRWLLGLREQGFGGVLADDMGLGKTLQTIALLCIAHGAARGSASGTAGGTTPSLVVVPTSLIQNWKRELERFAPHLRVAVWHGSARNEGAAALDRADVIVTTYALLVREPERWRERSFNYLILDEAQAIKNPRSAAREAVSVLSAEHRLCLSGTPVENHLGDLWSLFDFLMPGLLGSSLEFQRHFRGPIEGEGNDTQRQALRRSVAPFILRRKKDEVAADLPPKQTFVRPVELGTAQRRLYESIRIAAHADVRRTVQSRGIGGSTVAILDALMKLRQVCCDPRLVQVQAARRVTESAKLEYFHRLLGEQLRERRRVLVFSQFTSMLGLIGAGLEERGIGHVALTGATLDRQRQVDAFQRGDADVFLISLKAGGTGLNLTSADTVIHYDPWWNPAAQAQATDRAHRIGQTRPVFVHQLIVAGSVEERMLGLQRHKHELAEGLVGSGGATGPAALSEDDLSDLFAPIAE